ncbi:MAG: CBS domain-containing protein [Thermoplasmata archaeon]|nr:CBS domain-containing protein [Thermoplasmata archaeon]
MTEIDRTLRSIVKEFKMPSISHDSSVANAIIEMTDKEAYALLVPRKDKHDAYGIITKRDIIYKVIAEGKDPKEVKVSQIMSKPLVILTNLDLDIRWVAKAMADSKVSVIAVFDRGDFYGFATSKVILEAIYYLEKRHKLDDEPLYVSC